MLTTNIADAVGIFLDANDLIDNIWESSGQRNPLEDKPFMTFLNLDTLEKRLET